MPLAASTDFGARVFDGADGLSVHDHLFAAANTALPHLRDEPQTVSAIQSFLTGVARVDLFALKKGGTIDGEITAPLGPEVPALTPGATYLLEAVVRTLKLGHHLTQGTADSNEIWLELTAKSGGQIIASAARRSWSSWATSSLFSYLHGRASTSGQRGHFSCRSAKRRYRLAPPRWCIWAEGPRRTGAPVDVAGCVSKVRSRVPRFALSETARMDLLTTIALDRVEFPVARAAIVGRGITFLSGNVERLRHRPPLETRRQRRANAPGVGGLHRGRASRTA
jgi:hypothetical protein